QIEHLMTTTPQLTNQLKILNTTIAKLDLEHFVPAVNALQQQLQNAQALANVVDGSVRDLVPKVSGLDLYVRQAAGYNRTLWAGLVSWSQTFQTGTFMRLLVLIQLVGLSDSACWFVQR